ncbi:hypothetical protein [Methylobacillus flagellatus]|uniref:hypothetical protein n=1 Tax=Methylobacillus flagellatus TaxID=405 RepID=UPI0010F64979|nr:hypothetical protein [Methylobacillus flagellatus]
MPTIGLNIPSIERLPTEQQAKIRGKIADIVIETFIDPADVDYINARFMALNHQHRPFFWPALQAIEKYLKAALLFSGVAVRGRDFGHKLIAMANLLKPHDEVLGKLNLAPLEAHRELERLNLWGTYDPMEFIASVEEYGDPSNRYNYFGSNYEASYLPKLDQVVWALRSKYLGNKALCSTGGNQFLDYVAYEQNFCFAPLDYKHGSFYGKFSLGATVPSIEAALKGLYGHTAIFEEWLKMNITIKPEEINAIRNR